MPNEKITICAVSFNDYGFIENTLFCLRKITKNPYKVIILDNGSKLKNYKKLVSCLKKYPEATLFRKTTNLRGSQAHGTAMNDLAMMVDTPYFSILDADAVWLIKNWDEILLSRFTEKLKVIGTQDVVGGNRFLDFPTTFAILFETESFKKLKIDLRARDITKGEDTGYEMKGKYLAAGLLGEIIEMKNTRSYKEGPFKDLVGVGEYYLRGYNHIFASHFGRGSSLGAAKYAKGNFVFKMPIAGKFLRQMKGAREKKKWIEICHSIVNNQQC